LARFPVAVTRLLHCRRIPGRRRLTEDLAVQVQESGCVLHCLAGAVDKDAEDSGGVGHLPRHAADNLGQAVSAAERDLPQYRRQTDQCWLDVIGARRLQSIDKFLACGLICSCVLNCNGGCNTFGC